ncbi:MAG: hemolysin D, partial [Gammaproteobacteria bacterium]|nr:hemolysin D [Gammaproteobacteria bacterium]
PKQVETRTERSKLMFRIKVKVDPEPINEYPDLFKPGLPGVAYVRLDPDTMWPEF